MRVTAHDFNDDVQYKCGERGSRGDSLRLRDGPYEEVPQLDFF